MARPLLFFFLLLVGGLHCLTALAATPVGPFSQAECLDCHTRENPEIVSDWRGSSHAASRPVVDCVACHGDRHGEAAARSRQNQACTACHGGLQGAVTNSYRLSKHGVIATLEAVDWQWSKPLADGNYRTPTCAYCHLHGGDHGLAGAAGDQNHSNDPDPEVLVAVMERRAEPCWDCHSPRFVDTWLQSGEGMLALGRMKIREAAMVAADILRLKGQDSDHQAEAMLAKMDKHLRNVRLGVFHQSPDHQWWHGQPALDGDLLRIKGLLGDLRRRRAVER
jgi:hypothetical protein